MIHRSALALAVLVLCAVRPVAAGPHALAPPRDFLVSAIRGQHVTLTWRHARDGTPPDGYLLEGGAAPGESSARVSLPGAVTTHTVTLGNGVYFARVKAVSAGVLTMPSNETTIVVGAARPPSPPADVAVVAVGSDVMLTWRNTYRGGTPADVLIEVSGAVETVLRAEASETLSIGGVPDGTYTVALRARNAAGTSERSAPVALTLPGASVRVVQGPAYDAAVAPLPVRYEPYTTPRLTEFVLREGLNEVVGGGTSEFDAMLRLKDWVAAQFPEGTPDPYPPWDAMTILDWIRSGRTGGFCAQYGQIFVQALSAYGIPARYVGVGLRDNPIAHFTTEVWSNEFNKWVLLDVHFNVHFERRGVPLSALEVHEAFVQRRDAELTAVLGHERGGHPNPLAYPHRATEFFYYLHYHLKANHVTVPDGPPADLYDDAVGWLDDNTVPWEVSRVPSQFPHLKPTRETTRDRRGVEFGANQVWIAVRRSGVLQMTLALEHSMLQLHHFEYRLVDDTGATSRWLTHVGSELPWTIGPHDRKLEVRGVNVRGVAGPISAVAIVR